VKAGCAIKSFLTKLKDAVTAELGWEEWISINITATSRILQRYRALCGAGVVTNFPLEVWHTVTDYSGSMLDLQQHSLSVFAMQWLYAIIAIITALVAFPFKPAKRPARTAYRNSSRLSKVMLTIMILLTFQAVHGAKATTADFEYHLSQLDDFSEHSISMSDNSTNHSSIHSHNSPDYGNISDESDDFIDSYVPNGFPVPNVPNPSDLNSAEFRVMALNTDGAADWDGIWKQAKLRDVHALCLQDAEKPSQHSSTYRDLKQHFSHDATVDINPGLKQLWGPYIGGTVNAMGKGWNQRCAGFSGDKHSWGRYSVLKIRGKTRQAIWILSLYSPYESKDRPESYYNMILHAMKDYEAVTGKRLARDRNGDLCPYCQIRQELSEVLQAARQAGAELVITGDFNEKWQDNGLYQQWAKSNDLINVLEDDELTGGATTCFPTQGHPSDIDWVLCTPALYNTGHIKAGVLHEKIVATAHCPIFISIKARAWLGLASTEISRYRQHKYMQNYIIGKSDSKRIQTYQKLLTQQWTKFQVHNLKSRAEQACAKLKATEQEEASAHVTAQLHSTAAGALQLAYGAMNKAVVRTINKMCHRYATGNRRLTYHSPPMVEARRMRSRGWKLIAMWKRRIHHGGNPFLSNVARGKHRGGNRNARGNNPTVNELKDRLVRWFSRVAQLHPHIEEIHTGIVGTLVHLNTSKHPRHIDRESSKWQKAIAAAEKTLPILNKYLSCKNRLSLVREHHGSSDRGSKKCRNLKQIIRNLSIPKERGGAISKIEHNGSLITDQEQVCSSLVAFYDAWFGAGRENRWNCTDSGASAHPVCDRNSRSKVLIDALLHGNTHK